MSDPNPTYIVDSWKGPVGVCDHCGRPVYADQERVEDGNEEFPHFHRDCWDFKQEDKGMRQDHG